jgi:hypothetical protein
VNRGEQPRDPDRAALRLARFKAARERIRRIVDGSPPLTEDQRHQLALLLTGGGPPQAGR